MDEMKSAALWWIFKHKNVKWTSDSEQRGNMVLGHVSDLGVVLLMCLLSYDYSDKNDKFGFKMLACPKLTKEKQSQLSGKSLTLLCPATTAQEKS